MISESKKKKTDVVSCLALDNFTVIVILKFMPNICSDFTVLRQGMRACLARVLCVFNPLHSDLPFSSLPTPPLEMSF